MGLAWKALGWAWTGARVRGAEPRRRRGPRLITLRTRRRLRRWFGWILVTVGVIGLVHRDVPGVVPLLIGIALLQMGSGRVRYLLRRVDAWLRTRRERGFLPGLFAVLSLADKTLTGEGGVLASL
jgi:hypothetical protein